MLSCTRSLSYLKKMIPKVVFVLGSPGAGKGTQCQNIVKHFGYKHLSAGDLLREEMSNPNSEFGEMIDSYIKNGKIVPVDITCSLLERCMTQSGNEYFLIDGFPRNQDNLDGWNRRCNDKVKLQFILFFDCSLEICTDRCLSRGAAGSGRSDDNMESLKKRFNTYQNESKPIIEHYEQMDMVRRVDGNRSPDEVFADVKKIFEKSMAEPQA